MPKQQGGDEPEREDRGQGRADERAAREEESFVDGLIGRGEAVETTGGELPPGATHEIVGEDERGRPKIRRRRFSAS